MKKLLTIIIASFSFLNAQTHIVPEGFSGLSVSFKHDQNVDFFGEGKFLRDSYGNAIGFGYIYNANVGIDLSYGYSLNNRKDTYDFNIIDGESSSEHENFNFTKNFRSDNANVGDKTFSFGLTYYLNESQDLFSQDLPINLSLGFRYGTKNYSSDALKFLNQDFYGKFYAFEFGAFKEIETNASFYMIPRIKLSISNEKNIYNSPDAAVDGSTSINDTDSFKVQSTYFEIALPFILNNTSAGQPFIEPSIANKFGTTHLGLRFGFLF
jgi:hypothetical protein